MVPSIETRAQAEIISAALKQITGAQPTVFYKDDKAEILFDKAAARKIQNFIETQSKKEGKVKIGLAPVIAPIVLKKTWFYFAGAAALLFFAGRLSSKKK